MALQERALNETPEYYKNTANLMTTTRLRGLNAKIRLPYVTEILSGRYEGGAIKFKKKYIQIPLVLGLARKQDGRTTLIYPDGQLCIITNTYIAPGGFLPDATIFMVQGDFYKFRVYNLDIE